MQPGQLLEIEPGPGLLCCTQLLDFAIVPVPVLGEVLGNRAQRLHPVRLQISGCRVLPRTEVFKGVLQLLNFLHHQVMVLVGLKLDARYGIDDRVLPAALEDSESVTVVVKCVVFPAAQDWGA